MIDKNKKILHIVGAGLAGSEAAWQAANLGVNVVIHEMRPQRMTDAHKTDKCAELVCSNSFRSDDWEFNAVGLLHEEMRRCNSLIMKAGDTAKIPAGSAMAVDRELFSNEVTKTLKSHPNIEIVTEEVQGLPPQDWEHVIIATGPLTTVELVEEIKALTGEDSLSFFDALAPIVHADSINMDIAWKQSRYDKIGNCGGDGKDYINCPMNKEEYEKFIAALLVGEKTEFREWEKNTPYFEACLPIEVMAERGIDTLRYGPMKPVGLSNPNSNDELYAVVQLRQDNRLGTLYNMVGFQTKLKYGEQTRIFRMIPALENAEFARLGGIHKNSFLNSPKLLNGQLRLKKDKRIRFAGQITGCEGYVESAAVGLMAGRFAAFEILEKNIEPPPIETAMGAMLNHITGGADAKTFQPMNINFGLFPPVPIEILPNGKKKKLKGMDRKRFYTNRALQALNNSDWV